MLCTHVWAVCVDVGFSILRYVMYACFVCILFHACVVLMLCVCVFLFVLYCSVFCFVCKERGESLCAFNRVVYVLVA